MEKTYTTAEAADLLGISPSHVRRIVINANRAGQRVGHHRGRALFLTDADIAVLRNRTNQRPAGRGTRKRPQSED